MTLDEFLAGEHRALHVFAEQWRANMVDNPTEFPAAMELGDWDEQLRAFVGGCRTEAAKGRRTRRARP